MSAKIVTDDSDVPRSKKFVEKGQKGAQDANLLTQTFPKYMSGRMKSILIVLLTASSFAFAHTSFTAKVCELTMTGQNRNVLGNYLIQVASAMSKTVGNVSNFSRILRVQGLNMPDSLRQAMSKALNSLDDVNAVDFPKSIAYFNNLHEQIRTEASLVGGLGPWELVQFDPHSGYLIRQIIEPMRKELVVISVNLAEATSALYHGNLAAGKDYLNKTDGATNRLFHLTGRLTALADELDTVKLRGESQPSGQPKTSIQE